MSESKQKKHSRYYNFGRVFFPGNKNKIIPDEIRFQPLGNHVGNVKRLARIWQLDDQASRQRIIKSIDLHDMAKPQFFLLKAEFNKERFKKYSYSFSGHRFAARDLKYRQQKNQQSWPETLAIGHHNYAASKIIKDTYTLKKIPEYRSILEQDPLAYASELYILEMCDQIEAQLACYVCGDEQHGEERTFMEYSLKPDENDGEKNIYYLDPYPFDQSQIELKFTYWTWYPSY